MRITRDYDQTARRNLDEIYSNIEESKKEPPISDTSRNQVSQQLSQPPQFPIAPNHIALSIALRSKGSRLELQL